MKAIVKRELRAYFTSVLGWIFLAAFLFVFDIYFWAYSLNMGYPYLSYAISGSTFIFLIIIPILTMRSMAEDRRTKTDQLLYTAPISVPRVIMGKFLAILAIFSIGVAFVCICPPILSIFGDVPMAENYTAILGVWLFGLLAIAIGIFLSALTESQVIAAVLTFALLFLGYMMEGIIGMVSNSENFFTKALGCLAIAKPLDNFTSGILDISGIVYYVTGAALFLFFACQVVQKFRWSVSSRKIRRGVFNSSFILIVAVIVVAVNVLVAQIPDGIRDIDTTGQKLYTLSDETYTVLDNLKQDVTIYVLDTEDDTDDVVEKTLERYEDGSRHIKVDYIDPAVSPNFYSTYTDTAPSEGSLIVVSGDYSRVIDSGDLFEYSTDYSTYQQTVDAYDGEGQITSAISYVTSGAVQAVYAIEGHDETELDASFTQALEKLNLSVENLTLLTEDGVPDDAAAIVINGPATDFSEDDAQKVIDYLANGGKALITSSYEATGDMTNFNSILAEYGMNIEQGIVMESDPMHYYQYPFYLLPDVEEAAQTEDVDGYVMILEAQAIQNTDEDSDTLTWTPLLETSDSAYLKTNLEGMETYEKEEGDIDGGFVIGANVVNSETDAEVTVVASVAAFNDEIDSYVSGQNLALFKGIVSDYSDSEVSVSIDSKPYQFENLSVNQLFTWLSLVIFIVIIPLALLIIGILLWLRRRRV